MTVTERLLHYVSFDTQSDESSETCPSTAKQKLLGEALVEEMRALGIADARIDADGYVITNAHVIEGSFRADVVRHGIGFCAVSVNVPVSPDSAQNSALTSVKYSGNCPSRLHFNSL